MNIGIDIDGVMTKQDKYVKDNFSKYLEKKTYLLNTIKQESAIISSLALPQRMSMHFGMKIFFIMQNTQRLCQMHQSLLINCIEMATP